jgi:hypothetical protein
MARCKSVDAAEFGFQYFPIHLAGWNLQIRFAFRRMVGMAPAPGTDWTDDERAEIDRIEALCGETEHWELECSHTDAGDPWCVVYDRDQHKIVLHIARIDRRYVVVWPHRQRSVIMTGMEVAVDTALSELLSTT